MKPWKIYAAYAKQKAAQLATATEASWRRSRIAIFKMWQIFWNGFWFKGKRPETRFAGWVMRFTLVLCAIGALQAWIFLESERASVGISGVTLIPNGPIIADQEAKFALTIKNGGKSSVEIVDGRLNVGDPHNPLPLIPHYFGDAAHWHTIVLPEDTTHLVSVVPIAGKTAKFTASDVADINAGKLYIWLYGYITYRDRFSRVLGSETIGYCYRYLPGSDPAIGMFAPCESDAYVYIH